MSSIFVINRTDKKLKDGYAGVFYEFLPNQVVEVPLEVAQHVFGYGIDNKEPFLARLGWVKTANELDEGLERLSKWELLTEKPKKNDSLSPIVEPVPLRPVRAAGGKVLSAA